MMNIRKENEKGEFWACPCGNRADLEDFETVDKEGNLAKPASLWRDLHMCVQCGRIYDQEGNLVAQASG